MRWIAEANYKEEMKREAEPYLEKRRSERFFSVAQGGLGKKGSCSGPEEQAGRWSDAAAGEECLHVMCYTADDPQGVLVISHGFTESTPKYDELVYYFLQAGYHVYVPEHMGHGRSYRLTQDPSLVHVDTWKRYVCDLLALCRKVREEHPNLPLSLYAHSMGGGIGACAAAFEPELFSHVILSSPMIRPLTGNVPWPLAALIAQGMCLFGKGERYVAGQQPYDGKESFEDSASSSEPRFARYQEIRRRRPELQMNAASYGWLLSAIRMSLYLQSSGWKRITPPILIFQSESDQYVSLTALKRFAEKIRGKGKAPHCEYVVVPGTRHEIYSSPDKILRGYVERILSFLASPPFMGASSES